MCGITGFIDFKNITDQEVFSSMIKSLSHRGPDDNGMEMVALDNVCIGLGQARLSIIDLSQNGHQPMHFKHLSIVYNGEIYNYQEIKKELKQLNHEFITNSDTEVILHAFDEWGVNAVHKFIGMFSIFILDKLNYKVTIIRDRAGVKPFFYYFKEELFLFSSELKSFHKHPSFTKEVDENALKLFFDFGYVPAPYSIFKDCFKVEPGEYITIDLKSKQLIKNKYWAVEDFYKAEKIDLSYLDAKSKLSDLLKSACEYRMVSDVPVGVFLSGGYDSSLVAALLQKDRTEKIKTFTIGFEEGNDESQYAKRVADYLGTEHSEYTCTTNEAQDIVPDLPYFYDEPFSDSSAIPTILVSQLAVKKVKVALSADGGDEIFGGYSRYLSLQNKINSLNKVPPFLHTPTKYAMKTLASIMPAERIELNHKFTGFAESLNSNKIIQYAQLFKSTTTLPKKYVNALFKNKTTVYTTSFDAYYEITNSLEFPMLVDYKMYLQNDILAKVDRATMSVSLEGREPLVDHRLIEFAASLPLDYKIHKNNGKRILKDIVHDLIPKEIMDRPKAGFSVPIDVWLRGDLSYLIDEYLNLEAIKKSGYFNEYFVMDVVHKYKESKLHYTTLIWKLIVFQMWYFKWIK